MDSADPVRWQRVKALFHATLDTAPEERTAFLDRACGGDSRLHDEVASLLSSDGQAGSFIDRPAAALLAGTVGEAQGPRFQPGMTLGRFTILDFVGAGGMSEVYRARDERLGRVVAIKIVTDPLDPDAGPRLLREAQHASALNHPHICSVHEVEDGPGQPFIVLEYIEGESLREAIKRGVPPVAQTIRWGIQIARALDHAHSRGIVHRDLKSANVVVAPEGTVKVLDFGLSRRLASDALAPGSATGILNDASVAGTLTHIAPEVLRGSGMDARVDVWALGVMLYEMVSGRLPFAGHTSLAISHAIVHDPPDPLPLSTPPALRRLIERCLAKNPVDRYQRAADVARLLESMDLAQQEATTRRLRASSPVLATLAALALAIAGAAYFAGPAWLSPAGSGLVLAVLPFEDRGADPAGRFLSDGLTEVLIGEIGRIDGVQVIAPVTAMRYRDRPDAIRAIAQDTGAQHIVRGVLTRTAAGVHLEATLLDASSGTPLWSSTYDRDMRELQALQSTVAQDVARAVAVRLSADDATRLSAVRAVAPDVYEAYLKGRFHWNIRTEASLRTAVEEFTRALALDPTYAPAYAALADCYNLLGTVMVSGGSPLEWRPRAAQAAIKALQIDPDMAEAHATLGYVRHYNWEWTAAEDSFRRAIALNPSYALAHLWYANFLMSRLRFDESIREVTLAQRLDPLSLIVNTNVGWVLQDARRDADAIRELDRTLRLDPTYEQARRRRVFALHRLGRGEEAVAEVERLLDQSNASLPRLADAVRVYALAGRSADAARTLDQLLAAMATRYISPGNVAHVYFALGRNDEGFHWLEKAYEERANNMVYLASEPEYDRVRHDPRFERLVRLVGLP